MRALNSVGLAFLTVALAAMPFAVFLALPYFDWGVFRQVETVGVGLHAVNATALVGLMLVSVGDPKALRGSVTAPVLALAVFSAVGIVASLLADDPLRSLWGGMEQGAGPVWFAGVAVVALGATVLRRERPTAFYAAAWAGGASVAACMVLHLVKFPWGSEILVPYDFVEYLGITACLAAVPLLSRRTKWETCFAVALVVAGLAVSANRGAALGVLVAVAAWAVLRGTRPGPSRKWLALGAPAVAVAFAATLWGAAPVLERLAVSTVDSGAPSSVVSEAAVDRASVQTRQYGTVWGRSVSVRMVVEALLDKPASLLTGRGFGSFETVALEKSRDAPGRRFVAPAAGAATTYWDGDQKAKFHSHNLLVESILAAGLLGGAAWLAFLWALGRAAPRRSLASICLLLGTLVVTGGFWFLVNSSAPLLAMAVAACVPGVRRPHAGAVPAAYALATPAFASLMLASAAGAALAFSAAKTEMVERAFLPLIAPPGGGACTGMRSVMFPERQANVNLYRIFVRAVEEKGRDGALAMILPRRGNVSNFSCLLRAYADEYGDVEAMEASLTGRFRLYAALGAGNPLMEAFAGPDFSLWLDDIERFLAEAPGRTDVIVPFLSWAEMAKRPDRILAAKRLLPRLSERDPVRHHLLAVVAKAEGRPDDAEAETRRALAAGLGNIVPLGAAK